MWSHLARPLENKGVVREFVLSDLQSSQDPSHRYWCRAWKEGDEMITNQMFSSNFKQVNFESLAINFFKKSGQCGWIVLCVFRYLGCHRWRYSIDSCTCWECERRCCWQNPQTGSDSSSRTCRTAEVIRPWGKKTLTFSSGPSGFVGAHLSVTACMNSSINSSYSLPLILLCLSPIYKGSFSSAWIRNVINQLQPTSHKSTIWVWNWSSRWQKKCHKHLPAVTLTWLSVPTSRSTGRHCWGWTPPQAV